MYMWHNKIKEIFEDDTVTVSALIKDETIWLSQKAMAELFGIDKSGIRRHLAKIFETDELDEEVVVAKIARLWRKVCK